MGKPRYLVDADADNEVTVSRLESHDKGVQVWRVVASFTQKQAAEILLARATQATPEESHGE